jgi:adenine phosphoribosyltransferase
MDLSRYIINVPDFPEKGIQFKDITPLIGDAKAFKYTIDQMAAFAKAQGADLIVGPDARGFIFGTPVSYALDLGFIPVRKPGKLPRKVLEESYDLEYGSNTLAVHEEDIKPGQNIFIIDDLLATGGTLKATINLIEKLGGKVVGCAFLIELDFLGGRELLGNIPILSLLHY